MNNSYSSLLFAPPNVSEKNHDFSYLTERHIQAIWFEQKYFKNLLSTENESIIVLSPGIWNAEAGPDFLKAHIIIGNQDIKGDIEIHLSEESWYHHQHHLDERYNNVILHVGFWPSKTDKPLLTKSGKTIIRLQLEQYLTIPTDRLLKWIDLDLYPYKHFLGSGRCAHALFRLMPEKKILAFFRNAAKWRLTEKLSFLKTKAADPSRCLLIGIAMALGYKHNAEAFALLLSILWQQEIRQEEDTLAFCLGICGFFDSPYREKWAQSPRYLALDRLYQEFLPLRDLEPIKLFLQQKRPLNHPIRRLAFLSKMSSDPSLLNLYPLMIHRWNSAYPHIKGRKLRKQLHDLLPNYQDDHWNHHYSFEKTAKTEFLPLLGENIKDTIIINAFFPLLHEEVEARGIPQEMEAFENLYNIFPDGKTGKQQYLVHRFFGETQKSLLINKADLEQGLYQLHKDFCIHFEASCKGCPFVENYITTFGQ